MAAFIIGTKVVHGDRPKLDTYLRLDKLVSVADLDLAIEAQVKARPIADGHLLWQQLHISSACCLVSNACN